jgi:hypothetical protein
MQLEGRLWRRMLMLDERTSVRCCAQVAAGQQCGASMSCRDTDRVWCSHSSTCSDEFINQIHPSIDRSTSSDMHAPYHARPRAGTRPLTAFESEVKPDPCTWLTTTTATRKSSDIIFSSCAKPNSHVVRAVMSCSCRLSNSMRTKPARLRSGRSITNSSSRLEC